MKSTLRLTPFAAPLGLFDFVFLIILRRLYRLMSDYFLDSNRINAIMSEAANEIMSSQVGDCVPLFSNKFAINTHFSCDPVNVPAIHARAVKANRYVLKRLESLDHRQKANPIATPFLATNVNAVFCQNVTWSYS